MSDWYKLPAQEVIQKLQSDQKNGLTHSEAARRLAEHGPNELIERGLKSRWRILWEQFTGIMVVILILAALVSVFLREYSDAVVIMAIVVINAVLGYSQEYRAEQAMAALKKLAVPVVKVRRDGELQEIAATGLVPGDVVLLEAGNLVPADGRLVRSASLQVQESALTGESDAVQKETTAQGGRDLPLGDRRSMVYMGTMITYGRGTIVVTETGMQTELGKIAELIQNVERAPTPLQRRLDRLGRVLAVVALAIIVLVVVLGLLRGEDFEVLLLTGISMAVAAIPEGLAAVVTVALALGSQRMLQRNALVRKLTAVETLGSVTVICSDKTGTLTQNRMTVTILEVAGKQRPVDTLHEVPTRLVNAEENPAVDPPSRSTVLLLKAMSLCTDAVLLPAGADGNNAIGDPTETALVIAAAQVGISKEELEARWPRVAEVPFTSERKRMTTVHRLNESEADESNVPWRQSPFVAFSKGAVDSLLDVSSGVWLGDQVVPLDEAMVQRIEQANAEMAQNGQRVLGVAFRPVVALPPDGEEEILEQELTIIGLIGMLDPPRPEVKLAVATARQAGIRPVMITGDHPLTAGYIARELDIAQEGDPYLTGRRLEEMSLAALEEVVETMPVYARVSPEHKLNIVTALQDKGQVVAMTGDGVNDAPALKKADIGVAMGVTGTDVSKEAADMVLLDDNFATIVAAVEEGRVIYDNIRKFIKYTLSSNTGELAVMLVAPFLGMPLPLLPIQILWVNLVTDGLPGLALTVEPAERGIMRRSPFRPDESVFSRGIGWQIIWVGFLMGLVSLLLGYISWRIDPAGPWRTMVFTTLTLSQMGNALALRSNKDSLFRIGFMSNRAMLGAVLLTFFLQLCLIYIPFLQSFFSTRALTWQELAVSMLASTVVFVAVEIEKWLRRRFWPDRK